MSRSNWKPKFVHSQNNVKSTSEIYLQNRSTCITKNRLNQRFHVYNGKRWFSLEVKPEREGYLVGEFAPTRKRPVRKEKLLRKKKIKKD